MMKSYLQILCLCAIFSACAGEKSRKNHNKDEPQNLDATAPSQETIYNNSTDRLSDEDEGLAGYLTDPKTIEYAYNQSAKSIHIIGKRGSVAEFLPGAKVAILQVLENEMALVEGAKVEFVAWAMVQSTGSFATPKINLPTQRPLVASLNYNSETAQINFVPERLQAVLIDFANGREPLALSTEEQLIQAANNWTPPSNEGTGSTPTPTPGAGNGNGTTGETAATGTGTGVDAGGESDTGGGSASDITDGSNTQTFDFSNDSAHWNYTVDTATDTIYGLESKADGSFKVYTVSGSKTTTKDYQISGASPTNTRCTLGSLVVNNGGKLLYTTLKPPCAKAILEISLEASTARLINIPYGDYIRDSILPFRKGIQFIAVPRVDEPIYGAIATFEPNTPQIQQTDVSASSQHKMARIHNSVDEILFIPPEQDSIKRVNLLSEANNNPVTVSASSAPEVITANGRFLFLERGGKVVRCQISDSDCNETDILVDLPPTEDKGKIVAMTATDSTLVYVSRSRANLDFFYIEGIKLGTKESFSVVDGSVSLDIEKSIFLTDTHFYCADQQAQKIKLEAN